MGNLGDSGESSSSHSLAKYLVSVQIDKPHNLTALLSLEQYIEQVSNNALQALIIDYLKICICNVIMLLI